MDGSQHYVEAERLLAELADTRQKLDAAAEAGGGYVPAAFGQAIDAAIARTLAEAQVHATLALAAASASNIRRNGAVSGDVGGWAEALEVSA